MLVYLKLGPVHVHAGAVVVAEPLQILLRVDGEDAALQLTVNCRVATEHKDYQRLNKN